MHKKIKTKWIILLLCIFFISTIFLYMFASHFVFIHFQKKLDSISSEGRGIPYVASLGSLYKNGEIVSVFNLCDRQNKNFESILCVYENRIYFVYTDKISYSWYIASVDLETFSMEEHCQLNNPNEVYNRYPIPGDFKTINGFYNDGKIILNDHVTVLEYDLLSKVASQYTYSEYIFPKVKIYGSVIGDETIIINTENGEQIFTLNEISKKSIGMSTIYSLKDKLIWNKELYITQFFNERSVQYIENQIYVVGEIRNYHGQIYAIVMCYDDSNDTWKYITNIYTEDHGYCYVVPEFSKSN